MKNNLKIVMVGAPGSGKGTQSSKMTVEYGIPHISTGQIFREKVASKHPLGKLIESYINKGEFVPDEIGIQIVIDRLKEEDCKNGFILDGFPRSLYQAELLEKMLEVDYVINLEISEQRLMDRLCGRRVCSACGLVTHVSALSGADVCPKCGSALNVREDDKVETIKHRMGVYERETKPIVDFYRKRGKLIDVNSDQDSDKVFEEIKEALSAVC